jgi:hypothetical protein
MTAEHDAALTDKSEAALERLQQARVEMQAVGDAEPGRPRVDTISISEMESAPSGG